MGRFDTNLDTDALNQKLLGGSLAQVKNKMREENESHVENIDKQVNEKKDMDRKDIFKHILLERRLEDESKYLPVKLHVSDELMLLKELAKISNKISVNYLVDNLIKRFVEEYRADIEQMINTHNESKKQLEL